MCLGFLFRGFSEPDSKVQGGFVTARLSLIAVT